MVSYSYEEYMVVRRLHVKREYENFHISKHFNESGQLYEIIEMSGFVHTTHQTVHFLCPHRGLRTASLNMTDKGLWYESLLAWDYGQKDLNLLLTNTK